MMNLRRWNESRRAYEDYGIPEDWEVALICEDMDELVNCAQCGREVRFGETYSSQTVHNGAGMGFAVCPACHEAEIKNRRLAGRN